MFARLCDFQKLYGHCMVPRDYHVDKKLSGWISEQRTSYRKKRISKERIDKLNGLGFDWEPLNDRWEIMFAKLCEFQRMYGHCVVPRNYDTDKQLATWVKEQRTSYKKEKLLQQRIERLNTIGFIWGF